MYDLYRVKLHDVWFYLNDIDLHFCRTKYFARIEMT